MAYKIQIDAIPLRLYVGTINVLFIRIERGGRKLIKQQKV